MMQVCLAKIIFTKNRQKFKRREELAQRSPKEKKETPHNPSSCNTDIDMWEPNPTLRSWKLVKLVSLVHKHCRDAAREPSTEK